MSEDSKYLKMNPKLKREWLKALRSGEYTQAKHTLHNGKGFCCLGVYLDSCKIGDWIPEGKILDHPNTESYGFSSTSILTSKGGVQISGFNFPTKDIDPKACEILARMNDRGVEFTKIANWIEKNL